MFRLNTLWIVLMMMAGCPIVRGQQVVTVRGSAQVMITDNLSLDEARKQAEQLAIINAIENEFGTYVEQDASTYIQKGNTEFRIIGKTRVKGEWLKTLNETFEMNTKRNRKQGNKNKDTWVTCSIKGEAREVTKPLIPFKFLPLNCPEKTCRTYDFNNGEPFYLYFSTPVDGNLSIFMAGDDSRVYRLLPYKGMEGSLANEVPVKADRDYVFFAAGDKFNYFSDASYQSVDEMQMVTDKVKEIMELYIIFSPQEFGKPDLVHDSRNDGTLPYYLDKKEFDSWLTENRIYNPDFNYRQVSLTISK